MEQYQTLEIILPDKSNVFQNTLRELVSQRDGWQLRNDLEENFAKQNFFNDRKLICIETVCKRKDGVLIWIYDFGNKLSVFNITPLGIKSLSVSEYNEILNAFYEQFIRPLAADFHAKVILGKDHLDVKDYIGQDGLEALKMFSDWANKSTGNTHPNDFARWCEFVIISFYKENRLSTNQLEGWLIDNGWSVDTAEELSLQYEYGLGLLEYEHNRR